MDAFVLHGPEDLRREKRELKSLKESEVLIDVKRTGICGSDIHYYKNFKLGRFIPQAPLVLGHEFAGVVIKKGSSVTGIETGMRVVVEPSIECRHCSYCRTGRYNLCKNLRFIGTAATVPHIDGGLAEQVIVPASHCYVLDDSLDFGAGAMIEPLAVGANAVARVGSVSGKRILICGGGTIGQMVLTMAQTMGGTDITVSEPEEYPRQFALMHGASSAINPLESGLAAMLFADGGFDIVFEASGAPTALLFAYEAAAPGGAIVQIGTQPDEVTLAANLVMSKELTIFGSFRYAHVFPLVIDLLVSGRVNVQDMISGVFPYDETPLAVAQAASRKNILKIQIEQ